MRVALDVTAIPPRLTGAGVYVAKLADALATRDDLELLLVTRRDDVDRWQRFGAVHPDAPSSRPARLVWEQTSAPGLTKRLGVDVWHAPHYTMPVLARVPTVVTIHDMTFFDHPEHHERAKVPVFRSMIRVAARRADALACVSARTATRLQDRLSVRGRVAVIPHGVDHDRFRPGDDVDGDLAALATIGVKPPYLAYLATIEPRKNVPGLVRAFGRVRDAHPDLRLVLGGLPGWGSAEVDRIIDAAGVADGVDRLGYVPDAAVVPLLRQATAFVYPAFDEGFGLPVLEALACGAVVVTSADTVMADVADGAALLAPPGDDVALATALLRAIEGGPDIDALRTAGPAVASQYSWTRAAEQHVELYRSLSR